MPSFFYSINRSLALATCRKSTQKLYRHLYKLALRGMGTLNADGDDVTGEEWLLNKLRLSNIGMVMDVGANVSIYGYEKLPKTTSFVAFEPNPETFAQLKAKRYEPRVILEQLAVGNTNSKIELYDFADSAPLKHTQPTATLASTHKQVIEQFHLQPSKSYVVKQVTLDSYCKKQSIIKIDLLKIDAEGSELFVLQGAKELLQSQAIELVQFEFNEMHAYTRTFFKDFVAVLENYSLFRMSPNGLLPLGKYRPLTHEVFAFQNILAILKRKQKRWSALLEA